MTLSIMQIKRSNENNASKQSKHSKANIKLWAVAFWLALWQIAAMVINQEILLVSPIVVAWRLFELVQTGDFWLSLLFSFIRIVGGFLSATVVAVVLAMVAYKLELIKELLAPFMLTIKSIPVASFVILALIWFSAENLSILISFLMVLPIVYINVLEGICNTDKKLLEMAKVFGVGKIKKARYIYFAEVYPFFYSAITVSLGLCWKAGVAAEVIGIPNRSIGEHLFQSKIFLDTASLFAWTLTIIIISLAFERLSLWLLGKIKKGFERV